MKVYRYIVTRLTMVMVLPFILQPAFAQQNTKTKLFFEKVYLHTDRETYVAGEDIWFSAYLVNGQTNELFTTSNNLYAELISPGNKIVTRKVIRIEKGLGKGDFKLGDSIPEGTYRLRAYTSWMQNFGDNFVFQKEIQVYGMTGLPVIAGGSPAKVKQEVTADHTNTPSAPATMQSSGKSIRFFPEGGTMIEGLVGIVAFKAEDEAGHGMAVKGSIRSSTGEMLTDFSSDKLGFGSIMLNPAPGVTYEATGNYDDGKPFSVKLPAALLKGFSMYIKQTDSLVRVMVSASQSVFEEKKGRELIILGKSKGKANYAARIPFTQAQFTLSIPRTEFPQGIASISLYDDTGKPQCERLVYVEGPEKVDLVLTTDKLTYLPKGKVTVTVKATDQNHLPVKASLSLAAVDAGLIPENTVDIVSWLNLQSEIRGTIEESGRYFEPQNKLRTRQLDLLLLTQGWRDFTWKRVADSALRITYAVEQGITISGRVTENSKDKPAIGAHVTLMAPGAKGGYLFVADTDTAGRYYIDAVNFYGNQTIRLTSRDQKGQKKGRIQLDSLFLPPPPVAPLNERPDFIVSAPAKEELLKRREIARKINISLDTLQLKEIAVNSRRPIRLFDQQAYPTGMKDEVYVIDPKDYDYANLRHYLQRYSMANVGEVPFIDTPEEFEPAKPSNVPGLTSISYFDLLYYPGPGGQKIFPRLIVDGREMPFTDDYNDYRSMIDHQNNYLSLPVSKVKKVVIRQLAGKNGRLPVIYLTLQPGAMDPIQYDVIKADVRGYDEPRTFFAPSYPANKRPDARITLYWAPVITTNEKGEALLSFFNADAKTPVRLVVEGISDKGIPVSAKSGYVIK